MPALIIDSSVALGLAFEDERDDYSIRAFETVRLGGALVPSLWPMEVANILSNGVKRKRLTNADAEQFLSLLAEQDIEVAVEGLEPSTSEFYALSHRHGLTAYDAAYLRLALSSGLPLASKDKDLNTAAQAAGLILFR